MLIGCYYEKVEIGHIFKSIRDVNGIVHEQPCLVTRETTEEEFLANHLKEYGRYPRNPKPLDKMYYYEVTTD